MAGASSSRIDKPSQVPDSLEAIKSRQKELLREEIKLLETRRSRLRAALNEGTQVGPLDLASVERQLLRAKRQVAALESDYDRQSQLIHQEVQLLRKRLERLEMRNQAGRLTPPTEIIPTQRQILALKRELLAIQAKELTRANDGEAIDRSGSGKDDGTAFNYKEIRMSNHDREDRIERLNELGQQGWQVVGFHRNEGGSNRTTYLLEKTK